MTLISCPEGVTVSREDCNELSEPKFEFKGLPISQLLFPSSASSLGILSGVSRGFVVIRSNSACVATCACVKGRLNGMEDEGPLEAVSHHYKLRKRQLGFGLKFPQ